jgi:hypothetical protein
MRAIVGAPLVIAALRLFTAKESKDRNGKLFGF